MVLSACPVINDEIKVRWKNNECVVGDPDHRHCTYAGSLPLLTEYIDEDNISHHSLLGKLSREEVMAEYAPEAGEDTILTLLNDNQLAHVSRRKVERDLQGVVEVLDNQGYDVILLMSTANISSMTARNTIFLEPSRILPPLVSSIVEDHQVGLSYRLRSC